jgi:hypothetical protein
MSAVADSCRHACWIVDDEAGFRERAAAFLAEGEEAGQKTMAFGPEASDLLAVLEPKAVMTADPYVDFLNRGSLEPEKMFATFREQSAIARSEGYDGLCVMADMDWLLPAQPSADGIIGFEVLLDRVVSELGVSVVCAYRTTSFDRTAIVGMLCVHPLRAAGEDMEPPFSLVAGDGASWQLAGEVDLSVLTQFAAAFAATARETGVFDVASLDFIDVNGMRTIAEVARSAGVPVELRGARHSLQRAWQLAGFDAFAPMVQVSG